MWKEVDSSRSEQSANGGSTEKEAAHLITILPTQEAEDDYENSLNLQGEERGYFCQNGSETSSHESETRTSLSEGRMKVLIIGSEGSHNTAKLDSGSKATAPKKRREECTSEPPARKVRNLPTCKSDCKPCPTPQRPEPHQKCRKADSPEGQLPPCRTLLEGLKHSKSGKNAKKYSLQNSAGSRTTNCIKWQLHKIDHSLKFHCMKDPGVRGDTETEIRACVEMNFECFSKFIDLKTGKKSWSSKLFKEYFKPEPVQKVWDLLVDFECDQGLAYLRQKHNVVVPGGKELQYREKLHRLLRELLAMEEKKGRKSHKPAKV